MPFLDMPRSLQGVHRTQTHSCQHTVFPCINSIFLINPLIDFIFLSEFIVDAVQDIYSTVRL